MLRSTLGGPHLPPSPFLSRAAGEEGGDGSPSPSPVPPSASGMGKVGAGEEERWPSPHAMVACWERGPLACILMDGIGGHRCQRWCYKVRLVALTFPPAPFLSRSAGEEGGDGRSSPSPLVPCRSSTGEEGGDGRPSPSPSHPAAPLRGDGSSSPLPSHPAAPLRGDGSSSPSPSFPAASGKGKVGAGEKE